MKALSIADIHYGLTSVDIDDHIKEVTLFLIESVRDNHIDTLILAGDMFEQQLVLNRTVVVITQFVKWLDKFCSENKLTVLLLRGTISHDYKQGEFIEKLMVKTDFYYVDTLSILTLKGETVLCVPDSLGLSEEELTSETKKLLKEHNLTGVDVSVMHGMFRHHIDIPKVAVMDQVFFSAITKYYVIVGHNHGYKKWNNIYTPGSLTRWRHNEELSKGGLYFTTGKNHFINRVINDRAMKYITIEVEEIEDLNGVLEDLLVEYKQDTRVRLSVPSISSELKAEIKSKLSKFIVTFKTPDKDEGVIEFRTVETFAITKDNVVDLLNKRRPMSRVEIEELSMVI